MTIRPLIGLALAAVAALAPAAPAAAQQQGLRLAEARGASFPDRAWVLTLPERRELQAGDIAIRENGKAVEDIAVAAGGEAGARTFGVVLAIDASQSMHGEPIEQAMAAAREFAARRRPDQPLGLVLFSRETTNTLAPTTDAKKIDAALAGTPELSKGTRIYDAASDAIGLLRDAGVRAGSVVVMSDGADVGSATSAQALADLAKQSRTRMFTVGLESASFDSSTLSGIAAAGEGAYSAASSPQQLSGIYAELGEQMARQYLITYRSLSALASDVAVTAEVSGIQGAATAAYTAPGFPTAAAAAAPDQLWHSTPALLAAVLLVMLLAGLAAYLVLRGPRETVLDRINSYTQPRTGLTAAALPEAPRGTLFGGFVERILHRAAWWPRFAERVEISGLDVRPGQLISVTLLATTVLVWAAIASDRVVSAVIVAFLPLFVHMVLGAKVSRRRRAFADQLPETLEVVGSALRAGHSFESGLSVASGDAPEPMRSELRRIVADERLGVPLGDAFDEVARRMDCREFEHIGTVVVLQRESGGNTAELLDRTVETIRHRADLRRMVQTLTAQGRAGGVIVSALPVVIALALSLISPGYLQPMFEHTAGTVALVVAGCCVAAGWFVIRKVVDIKV